MYLSRETPVENLKDDLVGVRNIMGIIPWCKRAQVGQNQVFLIDEKVTQMTASALAASINDEREGHVWITVTEELEGSRTLVSIRCSH